MFNANVSVRNAALLSVALLLCSLMANAMDFNKGTTVALCDNYGKTWSVNVAACSPSVPLTLCLSGARDTLNLNGCGGGPQTMFGDSLGVRYIFNAHTVESSGCLSTFWVGTGTSAPKGKITGNVYNTGGKFGAFTLTEGACAAGAQAGVSNDPVLIK